MSTSQDDFDNYVPGNTTALASFDSVAGDDGDGAKDGDIIVVKYTGKVLKRDTEFDSGTFRFKLGEGKVIRGWDQGLLGMRVGGQRTLKIPPMLAYGPQGAGDGVIPPNADLIFDCELLSIESGPVAEFMAATGLGLNPRTFLVIAFILSIVLPKLGIGEAGII